MGDHSIDNITFLLSVKIHSDWIDIVLFWKKAQGWVLGSLYKYKKNPFMRKINIMIWMQQNLNQKLSSHYLVALKVEVYRKVYDEPVTVYRIKGFVTVN